LKAQRRIDMSVSKINTHPAFKKLLDLVDSESIQNKYLPIIEISGITIPLFDELISLLSMKTNSAVLNIANDNADIRRFLASAIIIELNKISAKDLIKTIYDYGYKKVNRVDEIGQFSITGDVLNFWPLGFNHPIRCSYLYDKLESAVIYDEVYGTTEESVTEFLIGDLNKFEFLTTTSPIQIYNPNLKLLNCVIIFAGDFADFTGSKTQISFDYEYAPIYYSRLDILEKDINRYESENYEILISTRNPDFVDKRFKGFVKTGLNIESGFISKSLKLLVLSDKEIFGTIFISTEAKKLSSKRARQILANLEGEIEIGDYIVHQDHGIGIYQGIKQESYTKEISIALGERVKKTISDDYIQIDYAEEDQLLVPLSQIDKLTKYISLDDSEPEITKLGKSNWEAIREKTKESIFAMARELANIYAKRELYQTEKINVEEDDEYEKFKNNFPYEITLDQIQTEIEVMADLKKSRPMNRLIVGDVGFGKTEIAMRASFRVVKSGFQVVVLCPTTILATQHEKVFKERFESSGYVVESLSRLNKSSEKKILEELKNGKVDILIGTHRVLSEDMVFKKLGLIVIDEEQKFGVKQKEKLKAMQTGVHVLSMSATPIPRSLSMALSSIQDISIIQTPPKGRIAIKNIVTKYIENRAIEAVQAEISRGGQVYYLYNEVRTIESKLKKLELQMPKVKFTYAHGQMPPNKLKDNVNAFYEGKFNVLLCTTIIENGLDMPNVNTIVVEHAQNFGLGQLYQLRGRVGRGSKQAYAYFFYDGSEFDEIESLQSVAEEKVFKKRNLKYMKRLKALKESNELGSGFKLASRDLEIRGAGNLLGKQQHGNIKQIGYALYMQMLAEEIEKLKVEIK
jgi:transcription-repair coupling factor (superfamily II helicase)